MNRELIDIGVDEVTSKRNARTNYGNLDSLTASIKSLGLIYPIVVDKDNVLIAGSRRLASCRAAGVATVQAIKVDTDYKSSEALAIQVDENLCRMPLSPDELDALIQLKKSSATSGKGGVFARIRQIFHHD